MQNRDKQLEYRQNQHIIPVLSAVPFMQHDLAGFFFAKREWGSGVAGSARQQRAELILFVPVGTLQASLAIDEQL